MHLFATIEDRWYFPPVEWSATDRNSLDLAKELFNPEVETYL